MTDPTASRGRALPYRGVATTRFAETINFDADNVGAPPVGWTAGVTGRGLYRWEVVADASAPSAPNVLKQSACGDFPWCVKDGPTFVDGYVEVKFRPLAGQYDQAGGVVWRWQDTDNYYVARANALENNVALYCTRNGRRKSIEYVDAPVAQDRWHLLRVEFIGSRVSVTLNGKRYIERDDTQITCPGAVGVWTKADSVTVFDDFSYGRAST